jgi:hypothetical protein
MQTMKSLGLAQIAGVGLIVGGAVLLALSSIAYGNPALYSPAGGAAVVAGIAAVRNWRSRWIAAAIIAVAGSLFLWEWLFRTWPA